MNRHPLEALLRPPVELWSTAVAVAMAAIALFTPWALLLPRGVNAVAAALLLLLALVRARQGWGVLRYQGNLRRLRRYALRTDDLPVSTQQLFLGRGFRWTQKHTQRLRDTHRTEAQRYLQPPRRGWRNPWVTPPDAGGNAALHGVEPVEKPVWMALGERVGHTLILGTTRVGKTRFAELMISQDIRRGDTVIVFDPKGDAELLRRVYAEAKRSGRERQFILFHLGHPEVSARYNAIGNFSRITEVATRIANQLPSEGNSAAFKEFAWRFVNIIARALVALGRRPDYQQVRRYINDIEPLFIEYAHAFLAREGPKIGRAHV